MCHLDCDLGPRLFSLLLLASSLPLRPTTPPYPIHAAFPTHDPTLELPEAWDRNKNWQGVQCLLLQEVHSHSAYQAGGS